MQFIRIGEYLAASRVSGPSHNLLQIRLGNEAKAEPMCERLPPQGRFRHEPLDEKEIVASVLKGVAESNEKFGAKHGVTHIRYIESDTKPESVYAYLASKIIEQLESGGQFIESKP